MKIPRELTMNVHLSFYQFTFSQSIRNPTFPILSGNTQELMKATHLVHAAVLEGQLQVFRVLLHRGYSVNQSEVEKFKASESPLACTVILNPGNKEGIVFTHYWPQT